MKIITPQKIVLVAMLCCLQAVNVPNAKAQPGSFNMAHTISDGAQGNTIAFDGLAFLTGNFCACTFIPPGKVADYFGFQYVRDNDLTSMGHTTDFLTVLANNLLYVLSSSQKADLIAMARAQVPMINQYGYARFPLINAFIRLRDHNIPAGSTGLDKDAVMNYSAELYKLDGRISIQRAKLYADIIKTFTPAQKHYLDSIKLLGMGHMPVLPEQIDKRGLTNSEFVAVMSFAGDIYTWYVGSLEADVYFCPERQGNYFGGFYIKDAPAMGVHGYSIDTALTQYGGQRFIAALNSTQASLIRSLPDSQRTALYGLVDKRTAISQLLRGYLTSTTIDTATVISLSAIYGAQDGEISYYYATNFSKVGWSLNSVQRDTLNKIRNLDKYPCYGAYLYSDSIGVPVIASTDYLFKTSATSTPVSTGSLYGLMNYPNPFNINTYISFNLAETTAVTLVISDIQGRILKTIYKGTLDAGTHSFNWDGSGNSYTRLSGGMYVCKLFTSKGSEATKLMLIR